MNNRECQVCEFEKAYGEPVCRRCFMRVPAEVVRRYDGACVQVLRASIGEGEGDVKTALQFRELLWLEVVLEARKALGMSH